MSKVGSVSAAAMAARKPAPPPPTITMSCCSTRHSHSSLPQVTLLRNYTIPLADGDSRQSGAPTARGRRRSSAKRLIDRDLLGLFEVGEMPGFRIGSNRPSGMSGVCAPVGSGASGRSRPRSPRRVGRARASAEVWSCMYGSRRIPRASRRCRLNVARLQRSCVGQCSPVVMRDDQFLGVSEKSRRLDSLDADSTR